MNKILYTSYLGYDHVRFNVYKNTAVMVAINRDILDLARLCVIRGVIRYLKIIKNQYEPSDKWDKLLIMQ